MANNILSETYMLSNGVMIPRLGLGTWEIPDDKAAEAVREAVKLGYRHIDTAQGYFNERGVGEGIRTCGLNREDIFVTTKLDAAIKDYDGTQAAIEGSLNRLGLDYIDLMLIHAPQPWDKFRSTENYDEGNLAVWCAMEKAYKAGRIRAIGVSNFLVPDLENIICNGDVRPMVNQVLAHISNTPFDLIRWCQERCIAVEAYSPIAHGEMLKNPVVADMASHYGITTAQLCIRYCLQLDMVTLPKTANPAHMATNADVDFTISKDDMQILLTLPRIENYGEWSKFPVFSLKQSELRHNLMPYFHRKILRRRP